MRANWAAGACTTPATLVAGACTSPISLPRNWSSDGRVARAWIALGSSVVSPIAPPTMISFSFALANVTQTLAAATGSTATAPAVGDRQSVVEGKSVYVSVELGGRRIHTK